MLAKKFRLTASKDFKNIYRKAKTKHSPFFVVKFLYNDLDHSRLAVVASKKNTPKAVNRNKAKRRVKSVCHKFWPQLKRSTDIIIITRSNILMATYQEVFSDLEKIFKTSQLI